MVAQTDGEEKFDDQHKRSDTISSLDGHTDNINIALSLSSLLTRHKTNSNEKALSGDANTARWL